MPVAKKGQRFGGRVKGVPNKATSEKALQAAIATGKALREGRKLAREVLDEFMFMFAGMAATYQPLPPSQAKDPAAMAMAQAQGREPNEAMFRYYAELAVQTAKELAPYQSPRFKAIPVIAPQPGPGAPGDDARPVDGKVVPLPMDATSLARVYSQMIAPVKG